MLSQESFEVNEDLFILLLLLPTQPLTECPQNSGLSTSTVLNFSAAFLGNLTNVSQSLDAQSHYLHNINKINKKRKINLYSADSHSNRGFVSKDFGRFI